MPGQEFYGDCGALFPQKEIQLLLIMKIVEQQGFAVVEHYLAEENTIAGCFYNNSGKILCIRH